MCNGMRRSPFLRVWPALAVAVLAIFTGACASTRGAVPRPFPVPSNRGNVGGSEDRGSEDRARIQPPLPEPAASSTVDSYALVGTALSFRGVPYRNGGVDP